VFGFYIPTKHAEDWKQHLAASDKHWKIGYSARTLAYCWQEAQGFPPEIKQIFVASGLAAFTGIEPLLALVEHKVAMLGTGKPSQNDLFVLAKANEQLVSIMIEGKVNESLDKLLQEWDDGSPNKQTRLAGILTMLGLPTDTSAITQVRYQLLHRMASAVSEAQRFGAISAVMLIHSFSPIDKWFEDYQKFLGLYGREGSVGELIYLRTVGGIHLFAGWVHGNERFLTS
jgi:hypothetical protein